MCGGKDRFQNGNSYCVPILMATLYNAANTLYTTIMIIAVWTEI